MTAASRNREWLTLLDHHCCTVYSCTHIHQTLPTLSMSPRFAMPLKTDAQWSQQKIRWYKKTELNVDSGGKMFEYSASVVNHSSRRVALAQWSKQYSRQTRHIDWPTDPCSSEKQRSCQVKITSLKCWRKRKVLTRMLRKNVALRDARFFCFSLPFTGSWSCLLFFSLLRTHVSPPPSLHAQLPIWRVNSN